MYSDRLALVISASAIGAVFQLVNDRACREDPSAFLVPELPQ
ncbi:hypothetical protein ACFWA9_21720 [Kitasatospora sp. NPDC059973]